jgi:hypothetical protein
MNLICEGRSAGKILETLVEVAGVETELAK